MQAQVPQNEEQENAIRDLEKQAAELTKCLGNIKDLLNEYEDSEQEDDENGLDQVQEKQQGTAAEVPDLDSTA